MGASNEKPTCSSNTSSLASPTSTIKTTNNPPIHNKTGLHDDTQQLNNQPKVNPSNTMEGRKNLRQSSFKTSSRSQLSTGFTSCSSSQTETEYPSQLQGMKESQHRDRRRVQSCDRLNQSENGTSMAITQRNHTVIRLTVSLTIVGSFDNVDDMKSNIIQALHVPSGGKFKIKFKSHSLIPRSQIFYCSFEVVTNKERVVAIQCIRNMAKRLREIFQTIVEIEMHEDNTSMTTLGDIDQSDPSANPKLEIQEKREASKTNKIHAKLSDSLKQRESIKIRNPPQDTIENQNELKVKVESKCCNYKKAHEPVQGQRSSQNSNALIQGVMAEPKPTTNKHKCCILKNQDLFGKSIISKDPINQQGQSKTFAGSKISTYKTDQSGKCDADENKHIQNYVKEMTWKFENIFNEFTTYTDKADQSKQCGVDEHRSKSQDLTKKPEQIKTADVSITSHEKPQRLEQQKPVKSTIRVVETLGLTGNPKLEKLEKQESEETNRIHAELSDTLKQRESITIRNQPQETIKNQDKLKGKVESKCYDYTKAYEPVQGQRSSQNSNALIQGVMAIPTTTTNEHRCGIIKHQDTLRKSMISQGPIDKHEQSKAITGSKISTYKTVQSNKFDADENKHIQINRFEQQNPVIKCNVSHAPVVEQGKPNTVVESQVYENKNYMSEQIEHIKRQQITENPTIRMQKTVKKGETPKTMFSSRTNPLKNDGSNHLDSVRKFGAPRNQVENREKAMAASEINDNPNQRKQSSSQIHKDTAQIQNILLKMEHKKDRALTKHEMKISSLRDQIKNIEKVKGKDKAEIGAVEDKLTEALKQRMEFICRCKSLWREIEKMELSQGRDNGLNMVQKCFGVECQRLENALPIYACREDIVSQVKYNQVSIILGETGSGKSTQIAQYLYDAGNTGDGMIVCTQPRKVAAVQLADRVAQEMAVGTGGLVGYKTGSKKKINANTKIVFTTDHSLLNECLENRDFQKYSCIIVDEAHERSIYTDILLGMIKDCLQRRPELRVIITSATIDPQVFIDYFKCPKEIRVSGRTYPVEVSYVDSSDDFENYETKAVSKAIEIHRNEAEGDILVFLTSPVEIQRCCEEFCKLFKDRNDYKCLPLHGQLLPEEQREVFSKLNEGVRKIVFATNCAETSITIDGIKYVIDTGVSKEMRYDAKKNLNTLGVHMISQSSADQRKGRAGRTACGKCYRLFSKKGFRAMRSINEPEILRVHLGQAILKLAELGVNIRDYDFVEPPSHDALQAALETLEFLGAIENKKITDMGRWISKLPFDPKLGYLVYKANKEDLLYDAVVLASVVSNGSGVFYRGLTETEAQISARTKAEFGLESGDIFTWYTIYKKWEAMLAINERKRWCKLYCINNKSMTYTKTCVDETITCLRHDMKLDVEKRFSNAINSTIVLSKLMLRAYGLSLCHFMGHSRAGYFSIVSERQVHLHPSCTFVAQNLQPEWLVFVELVETSREFMKGILAVKEEWIQEAIDEGHLCFNISKAKEKTLTVVHKEEVGMSVFRDLVGPRYSNVKSLEEMCEKFGMKHPILDADRELGTISIYSSTPELHQAIVNELKEVKSETISRLEREESELKVVNQEKSKDSPNIRAVIGPGGCIRQILMPHQTTEVLLRRVGDATEEDIVMKFSAFGNILETIKFKSHEPWGFIRYQSIEDATHAVEKTQHDENMVGSPRFQKGSSDIKNIFQAKASWIRRPVKGDGTAFIKCNPMDKPALVGMRIHVNGRFQTLKLARQRNKAFDEELGGDGTEDLIVHQVGKNATEETLKAMIRHEVLNGEDIDMKVSIIREKVPIPTNGELEAMRARLGLLIDPDEKEHFNIRIHAPRVNNFNQIAFIYFNDPVRGLRICERFNRRITINSEPVTFTPILRTTILVPNKIKNACHTQIDALIPDLKRDLGVDLEWKKLKEDHDITIRCDNPESIVKARECISRVLDGEIIDCNRVKSCQCLLTAAGQDYLQKVQKNTGCVIIFDKRTKIIHLYGNEKVGKAHTEIDNYVRENKGKLVKVFKLKSLGKPPGLMKALMNKFGPLLDGLNRDYKLSSVTLDCRSHVLTCTGPDASIEKLEKFIASLENDLFRANSSGKCIRTKIMPECVVCLDDVEGSDSLYRLEVCGHSYCIPCLQHQTLSCVQSNQFPLACAADSCDKKLVWKDLRYIFARKWITENKLVESSLNYLVSTQADKYKFCPTANCPVVYEVTNDENGWEFNCAACFASTCSSCHVAFHAGVSCKMAKSRTGAEEQLKEWCAERPDKRKICPGCYSPVEKTGGCNKMHCTSCHAIFCWICRKVCKSEGECYDHLSKDHSGIF